MLNIGMWETYYSYATELKSGMVNYFLGFCFTAWWQKLLEVTENQVLHVSILQQGGP